MKFLADVNIPLPLIKFLRELGHEVQDATVDFPQEKDVYLIKTAQANGQIILTRDKIFIELVVYPKYKNPLILISLSNQKTDNILKHVRDLIEDQSSKVLQESIIVINENITDLLPLEKCLICLPN